MIWLVYVFAMELLCVHRVEAWNDDWFFALAACVCVFQAACRLVWGGILIELLTFCEGLWQMQVYFRASCA